jgi:DnaK suppressor protein
VPLVAAKKPAKKAAKAVKKTSKPAARKAPARKPVAKKPVAPAAPAKQATPAAPAKHVAPAKHAGPPAPTTKHAHAPRPVGKVAVAVTARPSTPPSSRKVKVVPYETEEGSGRPILPPGYKPSPDEEYMSPLQLEYFRQRLLQWRADLVEESKQTIENLKDEVRDVGDEAERATRETENSLELRTRDRYRKLIGKIDSTLKRVDSSEYGYSVDSGEEIGLERLEARLTAERTIDEQERWEHLQKQIGD